MAGIFKVDWIHWAKEEKRMLDDIGEDVATDLKNYLKDIKSYYSDKLTEQINYNKDDVTIGSTEWAPAIINQGRMPGEWPNVDNIRDWVRNRKDGGQYLHADDTVVNRIAYAVSKKIKDEGIEPTWYVDKVLAERE